MCWNGKRCDHTSSEIVHPAAPSKQQSIPNSHLADPSSMPGELANHRGSCCGRYLRASNSFVSPFSIAFLIITFTFLYNSFGSRPRTLTLVEFHDGSHLNQ
nr:hypothetical protein [Tanacetum cinerariifolium]GEZ45503.1 hypothetical protein [Tanacetum cinerariifolium]